ncbi:MAG: ATP-binding cassette domain-containing protein [Chloroflexota bacterium]
MLTLDNVRVTFNAGTPSEVTALNDVSLDVNEGDFVTIIGANGAGKSTLFNIIAGTVLADRGKIVLDDNDISNYAEYRRSNYIGRVFQNPGMGTCPGLSIYENLKLASMRGRSLTYRPGYQRKDAVRFRELLAQFDMGLENRMDTDVAMLSGGQRQAITLLMATITQPKLLLLDEHTAALDPNAAVQILDLTEVLAEQFKLTVIMITHSMQQACTMGNRIVMMNRGEVIDDIYGEERHTIIAENLIERFRNIKNVTLSDRTLLS